ncbi:hypothetical protein DFH07DRAFT_730985, partial [Mycena maculata]
MFLASSFFLPLTFFSAEPPLARCPFVVEPEHHDLGRMNLKCRHCDALHWSGEKLAKSSNASPEFGMCCNHGKVEIGKLEDPPERLKRLLLDNGPQGKEFRNNMWQYNIALSFTSLGVKENQSVSRGSGSPIFKIQGELCHKAGSLIPTPGRVPSYAQLYIYEPHAALEYRIQNNNNLRRDTMDLLQEVVTANHQYADIFMHADEVLHQHPDAPEATVRLRVAPGVHRRWGNLPTADEVAVILPGDQSEQQARDIVLRKRYGPLMHISNLHPAYTPLYYVLPFPHRENGWHPDL